MWLKALSLDQLKVWIPEAWTETFEGSDTSFEQCVLYDSDSDSYIYVMGSDSGNGSDGDVMGSDSGNGSDGDSGELVFYEPM